MHAATYFGERVRTEIHVGPARMVLQLQLRTCNYTHSIALPFS